MGEFSEKVFGIVRQIPEGKVATYGLVARLMGRPQSGRYVGFALRNNPTPAADGGETPCYRVVFKDGSLCKGFAFGGPEVQRELLKAEKVVFSDDMHVDLETCLWDGKGVFSTEGESNFNNGPTSSPDNFNWASELGED